MLNFYDIKNYFQIAHTSGGVALGCYGRRELFIALKLVAAAQRGLPVAPESLLLGVDLPLPRLHTNNNTHYGEFIYLNNQRNC